MFGLVCFPSLALWSSSPGRKETLWWFCFSGEEVHRGKKRREREEGRKGDFKPKQPERDSHPLGLVWCGFFFLFILNYCFADDDF